MRKLIQKISAVLFFAVVFSSNAFALIIIDVNDNNGHAEFSFSGSDVVSTSGQLNNGFWLNDLAEVMAYSGDPNFFGQHSIVSGAADFVLDNEAYGIQDVWVNGDRYDHELGFRSHSNPFNVSAGSIVGLTGSIVTDLNYSWFNEGIYSFISVGPYSNEEALLTEGIQFNVGSVNPVPEPSIIALLGFGLAGFGFSRRNKKV